MKHSLILIPFFLLVLLNACDTNQLPQFSPGQWTAIAQTQEGMDVLPQEKIINWLNAPPTLNDLDTLEQALLGHYWVNKVVFVPLTASSNVFQVVVNCQCPAGDENCYSPDQMFMAVILKMYPHRHEIIGEVPANVAEMWVVRDAEAIITLGMAPDRGKSARWVDVKAFLQGVIDGNLFSTLVTPGAVP
jgi:hypothetical protein